MSLTVDILNACPVILGFPVKGVKFYDLSPAISDPVLLARMVEAIVTPLAESRISHVWGLEARGLYLAGAVALRLGAGLVPVRKPGKLPGEVFRAQGQVRGAEVSPGTTRSGQAGNSTYAKDYIFEVPKTAINSSQRVLIIDDILARGGSIDACWRLASLAGAEVIESVIILELQGLGGRDTLNGLNVRALAAV